MSLTARTQGWSARGRGREVELAGLLGVSAAAALLLLPAELAVAFALLALFGTLVLFDTWYTVVVLLAVRSSLDVLGDVQLLGGLNIAALLAALMIVLACEHVVAHRTRFWNLPLARPYLALLGVSFVGLLIAPDPSLALQHWLRVLSTFLVFVVVVDELRDRSKRSTLVKAIVLSAVVPVLFGLYQLVSGEGNLNTEGFNRIHGTFVHPSPFASYLLSVLPVAAVVWLHSRSGWSRLALTPLTVAIVASVLATFTRIAWLGLVVTVLVMASAKTRLALLLVPAIAAVALLFVPIVGERFEGATETTGYESTGAWRLRHWGDAIAQISAADLPIGSGLGSIEALLEREAHNEYLRVFVETGVLGSAAFLALYGGLTYRVLTNYLRARSPAEKDFLLAFLAVLAARLVMALTDNLLIQPALEWYFWALAAVAIVLRPAADEESRPPAPSGSSSRGPA